MNNDSVVHQTIRRSNRELAILTVLGIAVVIGGTIFFSRYLINFFQGPFDLSSEELLAIDDVGSQQEYYVTVTGQDSLDTGYSLFEGDKVVASYAALQFGDRLLLVKTKDDLQRSIALSYTGELVKLPDDVRSDVINDLVREYPDLNGMFLPFMLDTDGFRTNGYIGLAAGSVILLLSLFGAYLLMQRASNPANHPIIQKLGRFGHAESIVLQIDQEFNQPGHQQLGNGSRLHLTKNWLIDKIGGNLKATRYNDVIWFYQKVTTHRRNFIVTGRTYEVVILDRYGEQLDATCNKEDIEAVMKVIYEKVPWVVVGYDEQLKQLWDKDRARMIAAVDERHKEFAAQAAA